ncbi:MAG: glycosyltransferase [Planctomycetota bacterium]
MKPVLEIVTAAYPSPTEPHRAHFIEGLTKTLAMDFDIEVIAPRIYKADPLEEDRNGIPVKRFKFRSGERILKAQRRVPLEVMAGYAANALLLVQRRLLARRVSAVFAHWAIPTGAIAAAASCLFLRPFVLMVHGSDIHDYAERSIVFRSAVGFAVRRAKHVFAASKDLERKLVGFYDKKPGSVTYAPCGVADDFDSPPSKLEAREILSLPKNARVISYVGDLITEKGVTELAEATVKVMKSRDNVHLLVAGEGPLQPRMEKILGEAGFAENLHMAGNVPNDRVPAYIAASDVFCLPSYGEGSPLTVMEALTVRRPIVATRVGGIPELVRDGWNGILVEPRSSDALADALETVLYDEDIMARLLAENLNSSADYSVRRQAQTIRDVIKGLIRKQV